MALAANCDLDEFGEIARLFRPLTGGAAEALGLEDDAAVLAPPPGQELVVTTDTLVAGVHFLPDTPYDLIARKLLRVNLSDLAAKAAQPWGWFLNVAWPNDASVADREAFAAGLAHDQDLFGLRLFGGDTVRTDGALTVSATLVGLAPAGDTVRRSGAQAGEVLIVSGDIGDAGLGLEALAARRIDHPLAGRHQLPEPRLSLREPLRRYASAAADVSDGLLADAGRIAAASGLRVEIDLEQVPISTTAAAALSRAAPAGLLDLATAGDDYEIVCTVRPSDVDAFRDAAAAAGVRCTPIGRMCDGDGLIVWFDGADVTPAKLGWTHG